MFKIISEEEYEFMQKTIDKQDKLINELIELTEGYKKRLQISLTYYCDIVEFINRNIGGLPSEAIDSLNKIRELIQDEG